MASPRSFRKRFAFKPSPPLTPREPHPWPVDPELSRRVEQTRRQIAHTRRQLKRHVLPDRNRQPLRSVEAATKSRSVQSSPASDGHGGGR